MVDVDVNDDDLLDSEPRVSNDASGTTRGKSSDILLDKTLCQVQQPGLVIDRDNCSPLRPRHDELLLL